MRQGYGFTRRTQTRHVGHISDTVVPEWEQRYFNEVSRSMKSFTIEIVTSGWTMSPLQKVPTTISSRSVSYQEMGEVPIRRSPPRILVVDDNQDIMALMQELLATHGYDVVAVPDAAARRS